MPQSRMILTFLFALNAAHALGVARGAMGRVCRNGGSRRLDAVDYCAAGTSTYVVDAIGKAWTAACDKVPDPAQSGASGGLDLLPHVAQRSRHIGPDLFGKHSRLLDVANLGNARCMAVTLP